VTLPASAEVVVVGAGVHGLSTAVHLAELRGSGDGIVVLDKLRVGAGASGISGGIVRNFYLSAAMNEIVRRSVEIFELDPALFGFRQVGYVAVVPEAQAEELERIARQHAEVGYVSTFVHGTEPVRAYMEQLFPDWRARGSTAVLDEERSGWADPMTTLAALSGMAQSEGVRGFEGVQVVGFDLDGDSVHAVETTGGRIECDVVVLAPGPWARDLVRLLELPEEIPFHYWQVREGEYLHTTRRSTLAIQSYTSTRTSRCPPTFPPRGGSTFGRASAGEPRSELCPSHLTPTASSTHTGRHIPSWA